jgi:hypothetical protein
LLPTPQVHDAATAKTLEQVEAMRARGRAKGKAPGVSNLNEVVENLLLPTPAANDTGNSPEVHLRKKPGRKQVTSLKCIMEHGLLETGGQIPGPGDRTGPSSGPGES